jgi:DNA-binding LacI/PurR family transcriptional regulator
MCQGDFMATPVKRPTAADVARLSGVSTATVSYVLNRTAGQKIQEQTRERVLVAARELGYVPSVHAQALASGTSKVAVIDLSELPHGDVMSRLGRELAAGLEARGYLPIIDQPERSAGTGLARILALAGMLAPQIVLTATPLQEVLCNQLRGLGVQRFISLFDRPGALTDLIDDAARAQVRYLAGRGHKTIGYCGPGEDRLSDLDAVRHRAMADECAALHLTAVDVCSSRDPQEISKALTLAMNSQPAPTAIAAYNDEVAVSVISALYHLGVSIPAGMAVIGIDDSPIAITCVPPLTSVTTGGDQPPSIEDILRTFDVGKTVLLPGRPEARIVTRSSA